MRFETFLISSFFFSALLQAQEIPQTEKEITEVSKDEETLPERAMGWVLTLPARLYDASVGLHERSEEYSHEELAEDIDRSLKNLRQVLEIESLKADPDYSSIRLALEGAAETMNRLDQLYRDIQYYENWDDAALVVEWLGFLGTTKAIFSKVGAKFTRNPERAVLMRQKARRGFWAWAIIWLGTLGVDKFYLEPRAERLKLIYQKEILNTARMLENLIQVDHLLVAKGEESVLQTYPDLRLEDLIERLDADYAFLHTLEEEKDEPIEIRDPLIENSVEAYEGEKTVDEKFTPIEP